MEIKCCFNECSEKVISIKEYRIHFRVNHSVDLLGNYQCTYPECKKKFLDKKSLLDHLYRIHKLPKSRIHESNVEKDAQTSDIYSGIRDFQSQSTVSGSQNSQQSVSTELQDNDEEENIFDNIFLTFLMNLHAKSKLSKDVIKEIFHMMKKDVIDEIFKISNIEQSLIIQIEKAYKNLNTQYKFEKALKENDYLTSGTFLKFF